MTENSARHPLFINETLPPRPRIRHPLTSISTHTSNSTTAITHLAERRTPVQMPTHLWTNHLSNDLLFNSLSQLKSLGISSFCYFPNPNIFYRHTHIKLQSPSQAQLATLWLMPGQWQLPSCQYSDVILSYQLQTLPPSLPPLQVCCCCRQVASVMSNSVQPHRWQPTRLHHPWDSPGKNTGVGCHFLLQCMKVKLLSHVWLLATPWTAAYQAPPSMGFSRQEYWSGLPLPSPPLQV